jgi:hypothetical protein
MASHRNEKNPYRAPDQVSRGAVGTRSSEARLSPFRYFTVVVPPLITLTSVGLGLLIDRDHTTPKSSWLVILLVGPGALAIGLACGAVVLRVVSPASTWMRRLLWGVEIGLILFVYSQILPYVLECLGLL